MKKIVMRKQLWSNLFCLILLTGITRSDASGGNPAKEVYLRINQLGYLTAEPKVAILFSMKEFRQPVDVIEVQSNKKVFSTYPRKISGSWAGFKYFYECDFTHLTAEGRYYLKAGKVSSPVFTMGDCIYVEVMDSLLNYLRQQRCGYNPFWDEVCHQLDGRCMYSAFPDSTFIDVSGGWHDAGDDLKYLLTSSYATASLLLAYRLNPKIFNDHVNQLGQPFPNDIPDILDEARWGLDWLHKLHPQPTHLYHQVGDDRDHVGWKYPFRDSSDYGWGKGRYRVVYFADGKPQGLGKYKSNSNGLANLTGRYAAAMAMASEIWKEVLHDTAYSIKCLQAAREVYELGKNNEGVQQGNSYGAPYRYGEDSWADDMEWGAAELYRVTADENYLKDAMTYSQLIGAYTWMGCDSAEHYRYYPFLNAGHYSLHSQAPENFKKILAAYYREGIEKSYYKAQKNPFHCGVPFIWCSNNLVVALISQCYLYQQMSGDKKYDFFMREQRDWLWGRNPWGTSMLVGLPAGGEFPQFPHASTYALTGRQITGGLVDGPVYLSIFGNLKGLYLSKPDEFAIFQGEAVYHDDLADYSTNEPTLDGTAAALLALTFFTLLR